MSSSSRRSCRALPVFMGVLALGCARPAPSPVPAPPALRTAFRGVFLVGAALNAAQFSGQDTLGAAIVKAQFNSITPENALKWASLHPRPGTYDFAAADRYVAFGERNGMFIVGHNLVWHNQTPRWVFQDSTGTPVSRDTLLARLRDHIHTVVGRYRGRIKGWDVVNEALGDDGTLRRTPWLTILGEDYLAGASPTGTPGSTTSRCADARIILCCSVGTAGPSRRSWRSCGPPRPRKEGTIEPRIETGIEAEPARSSGAADPGADSAGGVPPRR